jgi:hypothetical protein
MAMTRLSYVHGVSATPLIGKTIRFPAVTVEEAEQRARHDERRPAALQKQHRPSLAEI